MINIIYLYFINNYQDLLELHVVSWVELVCDTLHGTVL